MRKIIGVTSALFLSMILMLSACITVSAADATSDGLAAWANTAYNEKWDYVFGGTEPGGVDCSGLIYAYMNNCGCTYLPRTTDDFVLSAPYSGYMDSLPEIPGIVLYYGGHVGVYMGGGVVIEAQTEETGVERSSLDTRWQMWMTVYGIAYPDEETIYALSSPDIIGEVYTETTPPEDTATEEELALLLTPTPETEPAEQTIPTLASLNKEGGNDINDNVRRHLLPKSVTEEKEDYSKRYIAGIIIWLCIGIAFTSVIVIKKTDITDKVKEKMKKNSRDAVSTDEI